MKLSLLALSAVAPLVSAHYFFDTLIIDGQETKSNEFVRSNTRELKYNPTKWENIRDDITPDDNDFRCNKGAFTFAGQTGTAEVKAGSKLAMKLAVGATMQHPGPALVYMSKAPSTANTYEGDGEWFKIYEESVCNTSGDFTRDAWCTWDKDRIEFTIPADLPDGEYLIRPLMYRCARRSRRTSRVLLHVSAQTIHLLSPPSHSYSDAYPSCAQVKVVGGGSGTPGPTVKFPGAYKKTDPSFNFSIYGGYKEYPMPGPAVWTGGSSSNAGSSAPNTTESSVPNATESSVSNTIESSVPNTTESSGSSQPTAPPAERPVGTCSSRRSKRRRRNVSNH